MSPAKKLLSLSSLKTMIHLNIQQQIECLQPLSIYDDIGDVKWTVGSGQWTVDSGQWAVGSGQWTVGGQRTLGLSMCNRRVRPLAQVSSKHSSNQDQIAHSSCSACNMLDRV